MPRSETVQTVQNHAMHGFQKPCKPNHALKEKKSLHGLVSPLRTPLPVAVPDRETYGLIAKLRTAPFALRAAPSTDSLSEEAAVLKAIIVGNIGSDPQQQYSQGGQAMLRFNVASNYRQRDQAGNWSDATEWVRVTVFGKRAETLGQHLKKGTRVYVDGRLEARPWTDQQGTVKAGLELIANDVEFMSSRQDGGQRSDGDGSDIPF